MRKLARVESLRHAFSRPGIALGPLPLCIRFLHTGPMQKFGDICPLGEDVESIPAFVPKNLFPDANILGIRYSCLYDSSRFLSVMSVVRSKLQLVGTAAMLVASKMEEIYPPELAQYVYVTDDTYTGSQIIRMEALLLNTLGFSLGAAHSLAFMRRLAVKAKVSRKVAHLAQYICELSLITDSSLMYKPSEIAAGALVLALDQTNNSLDLWTDEVERFADIDRLTLKTVVGFLHKLLLNAATSQHKATTEKYCHARYSSVAMYPPKAELPKLI